MITLFAPSWRNKVRERAENTNLYLHLKDWKDLKIIDILEIKNCPLVHSFLWKYSALRIHSTRFSSLKNLYMPHLQNVAYGKTSITDTVNPRFSPWGLIVNFEIWHWGLFEGGGLLKRFVLYMWAYSKPRDFCTFSLF